MQNSLVSIVCCLVLSACSHFPCEGEKGADTTSPNQQLTATVVYIGCGAIGKDATWVTLHRTGEKYDRSDDIVFSTVQQKSLEIAWKDDSHLSVYGPSPDEDRPFQATTNALIYIS